jgi:hypothetical protein
MLTLPLTSTPKQTQLWRAREVKRAELPRTAATIGAVSNFRKFPSRQRACKVWPELLDNRFLQEVLDREGLPAFNLHRLYA